MNEHWERWVKSSIYNNFRLGLGEKYIWFEGEERKVDEPPNRYEFKMLGPDYTPTPGDGWLIDLVINIQVITNKDPKEPFRHLNYVGKLQTLFPRCLSLYKFGNVADVDTKARFATVDLEGKIKTTDFGLLDPTSKILRTTVEAAYCGNVG
jgi:hypothetical protein